MENIFKINIAKKISEPCPRCEKNHSVEDHSCPYSEEIHGDYDSLCNCCEDCERQCAIDI